jgi:HSP20 family protein
MYTYYNPTKRLFDLMRESETALSTQSIPMNVIANEDSYEIQAFLPNLKAEDIEIEILENRIIIRGEYPDIEQTENTTYLLREQPVGKFSRSLRMPKDLDANNANAKVKDGVLTLTVPQAEHAKAKMITVKAK